MGKLPITNNSPMPESLSIFLLCLLLYFDNEIIFIVPALVRQCFPPCTKRTLHAIIVPLESPAASLWHFRMRSNSPRGSPIDLLNSHVWVFQTAAKIIMNFKLVFSLVTWLHQPLRCHLHLWLYHVLISLNTSTHNGFPAVSMKIC